MSAGIAIRGSGIRRTARSFPKSNAGKLNAGCCFSGAPWVPLVLQWRVHPATADGYRSLLQGTPGPPAFVFDLRVMVMWSGTADQQLRIEAARASRRLNEINA